MLTQKSKIDASNEECSFFLSPHYRHYGLRIASASFGSDLQVFCRFTNRNAETHCCVSELGFVMFWDRQSHNERVAALNNIQGMLRRHHRPAPGPEWNGSTELAG
jgi:hypothetical protein